MDRFGEWRAFFGGEEGVLENQFGWTPERVRKLRGEESRAVFAQRLGVSPLTVYRWELPRDAAEARSPRGKVAKRLEDLAKGGPHRAPLIQITGPAEEPSSSELLEVLPVMERLLRGEFRRTENELLSLLTSGSLKTAAARALATQALARQQVLARADVRGAFATLLPLLGEAERGLLPTSVTAEVYVTAALVFSGLDGRVFDAGKTNAFVTRAEPLLGEGAAASRFLLWVAKTSAAYVSNEPAVAQWVLSRATEAIEELSSPLLRCYAEEMKVLACYFWGRYVEAPRHIAEMMRLATEGSFHYVHSRFLAQAALQRINDGADPVEVLALVGRVTALDSQSRIVPGWHLLYTSYAAGEAYVRLGRFLEAEGAYLQGISIADEIQWSFGGLPLLLTRLYLLLGRSSEIRPLATRVSGMHTAVYPELMRLVASCVDCIADAVEGKDPEGLVARFESLTRALEAGDPWVFLRRTVVLSNAAFAVFLGSPSQAEGALRRAARALDAAPSAWGGAVVFWLRGVFEYQEGRPQEARPLLENALLVFERTKDQPQAALTRQVLALVLASLSDPNAEALQRESEEERERLGLVPLPLRRAVKAPSKQAHPSEPEAALSSLLPSIARLCVRGMSHSMIRRELVQLLSESLPSSHIQLSELDSEGSATPLEELGERQLSLTERLEFGDGTGQRFRLSLGGELPAGSHALLVVLTQVSSLALEVASLRGLVERPQAPPTPEGNVPEIPGFISASPSMRRLKADLARLSKSRATIIIQGESGSGKEVVARAIHDLSIRADKPYVAFNCAAVPRELFEGQLFGYRKGAFTGAASDQPGVIRAAEGGTLFMDEVAELPLEVQAKLLRFLENGEIFPLGEKRPLKVDVRVIAATFRDLEKLVREGRFREDLFYRLQVVPLRLPPLRERPEDLVALAGHFVRLFTPKGQEPPVLSRDALAALTSHSWPGNVRELRNVIERTLAFAPLPAVLASEHLRLK